MYGDKSIKNYIDISLFEFDSTTVNFLITRNELSSLENYSGLSFLTERNEKTFYDIELGELGAKNHLILK